MTESEIKTESKLAAMKVSKLVLEMMPIWSNYSDDIIVKACLAGAIIVQAPDTDSEQVNHMIKETCNYIALQLMPTEGAVN